MELKWKRTSEKEEGGQNNSNTCFRKCGWHHCYHEDDSLVFFLLIWHLSLVCFWVTVLLWHQTPAQRSHKVCLGFSCYLQVKKLLNFSWPTPPPTRVIFSQLCRCRHLNCRMSFGFALQGSPEHSLSFREFGKDLNVLKWGLHELQPPQDPAGDVDGWNSATQFEVAYSCILNFTFFFTNILLATNNICWVNLTKTLSKLLSVFFYFVSGKYTEHHPPDAQWWLISFWSTNGILLSFGLKVEVILTWYWILYLNVNNRLYCDQNFRHLVLYVLI